MSSEAVAGVGNPISGYENQRKQQSSMIGNPKSPPFVKGDLGGFPDGKKIPPAPL
jgi:hypothetical protein